jgi:hypothetical protein
MFTVESLETKGTLFGDDLGASGVRRRVCVACCRRLLFV